MKSNDSDIVFHICDHDFQKLMSNPQLFLPKRWDGRNFEEELNSLFSIYLHEIISLREQAMNHPGISNDGYHEILSICSAIKECVHAYHCGFPTQAYSILESTMEQLMYTPLDIYQKTGQLEELQDDSLFLYRVRKTNGGAKYSRKEIFHVPANHRSLVSTCRYSIAGYPSLYLSTSLDLAVEEIGASANQCIASRFKLNRSLSSIDLTVLELGIKPQDFISSEENNRDRNQRLYSSSISLNSPYVRNAYLKWYPVIAACSFIRANRSTPFASEYIVPQLLMQWIRINTHRNRLMGLRYFSCASMKASDAGFDYVFPTSNWDYEGNYCTVLRDAFQVTEPVYIKDYTNSRSCEKDLNYHLPLDKI